MTAIWRVSGWRVRSKLRCSPGRNWSSSRASWSAPRVWVSRSHSEKKSALFELASDFSSNILTTTGEARPRLSGLRSAAAWTAAAMTVGLGGAAPQPLSKLGRHIARAREFGYAEHAFRCLESAKAYMAQKRVHK